MTTHAAGSSDGDGFDPIARCLAHVAYAAAAVAEAAHGLRAAVLQARSAGATWTEIGDVLGISRRAASQRFAGR
jgi:Homeodomain-like domain-containing protein